MIAFMRRLGRERGARGRVYLTAERRRSKDVQTMFDRGLVEPDELLRLFAGIEPELYRYPAIDAAALRRRIEAVARDAAARP